MRTLRPTSAHPYEGACFLYLTQISLTYTRACGRQVMPMLAQDVPNLVGLP